MRDIEKPNEKKTHRGTPRIQPGVHQSFDTLNNLKALGLDAVVLREIVKETFDRINSLTENYPLTASGFYLWAEGTCLVRDRCDGYEKDRLGGLELASQTDGCESIIVVAGNQDTGNPNRMPRTLRERGRSTIKHVVTGNQQHLIYLDPDTLRVTGASSPPRIWVLLIADVEGELRLELSLAASVNRLGVIDDWSSRNIIEPVATTPWPDPDQIEDDSNDEPDIDFVVARRA